MERAMIRPGQLGTALILALLAIGATVWVLGHRSDLAAAPAPAESSSLPPAPASAHAWYDRGNDLARGDGDLSAAIEAYRRALVLAPEMAEAHYALGLALLRSGDGEGAVAEIESALGLAPSDASWRPDAENAMVRALLLRSRPATGD
jgi:Flp pilus assembly protein TadD